MKSLINSIVIVSIFITIVQAQVSFVSNGQQLNNLAGRGVALADFNGDGALDAFIVNENGPEGQGDRVYFGDGHGQFFDSGQILENPASWGNKPAVADIDGDSTLDVITGNTVWLNDGTGHFTSDKTRFSDSDGTSFMAMKLADLNGDGFIDLFTVIFENQGTQGRVYLNDSHGRFLYTGQPLGQGVQGAVALGDVNNDGVIDAVVSGWRNVSSDPCPNRILLNDSTGHFTETGQVLDEGLRHSHGLALGDFDHDKDLDIVLVTQQAPYARLYINDGHGHFTAGRTLGNRGVEKVAVGDFNGDNAPDIFLACIGANEVWLNDGTGAFSDSGLRLGTEWTWDAELGDINSDGMLDVIAANIAFDTLSADPWYIARGRLAEVWLNTTKNLVDITYVANEGFLISGVTGRILIDGIFTEGYGRYPVPSGDVLTRLRNAASPFDHLTAMLITHNHADHINPFYTIQHLQNDSMCTLIGSSQVNTLLKTTVGYNQISNRVMEILASNSIVDTSIQNTTFKIVPLPHSDNPAKDIQNRGFVFNVGGFKIFHCGDAVSTHLQDYQKLNLSAEKIDVAFLPTWFFDGGSGNKGREIIDYLAPKAIIMMHIQSDKFNYYQNLIKTMAGIPPVYIVKSSLEVLTLSDSSLVTAVKDRKSELPVPDDFKLSNNFPNPFNPSTTIPYSLLKPSHAILAIHNVLGQRIRILSDSFQIAGDYSLVWDGKDDQYQPVSSGIYFYKLGTKDRSIQKKMLLIR